MYLNVQIFLLVAGNLNVGGGTRQRQELTRQRRCTTNVPFLQTLSNKRFTTTIKH